MSFSTTEAIRAVIFDMDGVIIDSEPIQFRLERYLFSELGFELPESDHNAFLGVSNFKMFAKLKERFGFTENIDEIVNQLRQRYLLELKSIEMPIIEGVMPLISSLASS